MDSTCICHPVSYFDGVPFEHGTLAIVQLLKATYLLTWLQLHRRRAVSESGHTASDFFVLPVYARFLKFEAWQCIVWGVFFLAQFLLTDQTDPPRLAIVTMQATA